MAETSKSIRIDIVSDVVCPWCVIGFKQLGQALEQLGGEVDADLKKWLKEAYSRAGS